MAEENQEICGFLDVKHFSGKSKLQRVTKRTLGSWKVWHKHWCSIKKLGPGLGVKVQLDCAVTTSRANQNEKDNSITIPFDAVIYRTQSKSKQFAFGIFPWKDRKAVVYLAANSEIESQHWMANIRQMLKPRKHDLLPGAYSISIIDNAHSKVSGLTGLYGDLLMDSVGITVTDVHSGEIIENLEWDKLAEFHLATAGKPEDVKCICVIHTTSKFRVGVGQLYIFCTEATKLLHDLVTRGRGSKQRQTNRRPISLSDGDLRVLPHGGTTENSPLVDQRRKLMTSDRGKENYENCEVISGRSSSKVPEPIYQPEPSSNRHSRVSDISTASGIYEEIPEDEQLNKPTTSSRFYPNQPVSRVPFQEPPPLPPRQRCASDSVKEISRSQNVRIQAATFLPLRTHRNFVQNTLRFPRATDESNYVPMSPQVKDVTSHNSQTKANLQDNDYVFMR